MHKVPTKMRYSREFKLNLVRQVQRGVPVAEVSRQAGVDQKLILQWCQKVTAATVRAREADRYISLDAEVVGLEERMDSLRAAVAEVEETVRRLPYEESVDGLSA